MAKLKAGFDLKKAVSRLDKRHDDDKDLRQEWDDYLQAYKGEYWDDDIPKELSEVTANYLFANIQQILPLMTDNRPVWSVVAQQAAMQPVMNVWSQALRYLWDKLGMDVKVPEAYHDALLSETGFFQVDWDPDAGPDGEVRVDVVDPRHMIFPSGYDTLDECPWVCKRRTYPLSYVHRMYPEHADDVTADKGHDRGDSHYESDRFDNMNEWVTLYDLWMQDDTVEDELEKDTLQNEGVSDKAKKGKKKLKYPNGRFLTFTKTGRDQEPILLDDYKSPYGHGKSPWVPMYDYRVPHQIWGMGECRQIQGLIDELNELLQSMSFKIKNQSRANYVVDADILDDNVVRQGIHRGGQVFVKKAGGTPGDPGIDIVPMAPPLTSEYKYLDELRSMIEEISGVTDISKGTADKRAEQTAQEIATLIETTYTRTRQRVRNQEWSLETLLKRILSIMMENYGDDRPFSVTKDDQVSFASISNRKETAQRIVSEANEPEDRSDPYGVAAQDRALEELMEAMPGETDHVLARFDISIQTNSTLPLDKQSLANLALRLLQMGAIDGRATLDTLNFPNKEKIATRMEQRAQQESQAASGPAQGLSLIHISEPTRPY